MVGGPHWKYVLLHVVTGHGRDGRDAAAQRWHGHRAIEHGDGDAQVAAEHADGAAGGHQPARPCFSEGVCHHGAFDLVVQGHSFLYGWKMLSMVKP